MSLKSILVVLCLSAALSAQTIAGTISGYSNGVISLTGAMQVSPGTITGADPCQVPQMLTDALGTFATVLDNGSPQNAPVKPVPGVSPDQLAAGLQYILGNAWYQVCELHTLQTQLAQDESKIQALQVQVTNLLNGAGGLQIGGITVNCPQLANCFLAFGTSVPALGYVRFGPTPSAVNQPAPETGFSQTHSIQIHPGSGNTLYYYYVCAVDQQNHLLCDHQPPIAPLSFTSPAS